MDHIGSFDHFVGGKFIRTGLHFALSLSDSVAFRSANNIFNVCAPSYKRPYKMWHINVAMDHVTYPGLTQATTIHNCHPNYPVQFNRKPRWIPFKRFASTAVGIRTDFGEDD